MLVLSLNTCDMYAASMHESFVVSLFHCVVPKLMGSTHDHSPYAGLCACAGAVQYVE